jgi:hypothetical protein
MKIGEELTPCTITPKDENVEIMEFGVDYETIIVFQFEERFARLLKSGMNIGLYEGKKLIGHGYMQ